MALPRRQRRLLEAIDRQMTSADPRLARMFGAFGRFWAGEPLPPGEQLPTRAGRFRSGLWEALAAGVWPAPPLTDLLMTDATGRPGTRRGSGAHRADRARHGPDGPAQSG